MFTGRDFIWDLPKDNGIDSTMGRNECTPITLPFNDYNFPSNEFSSSEIDIVNYLDQLGVDVDLDPSFANDGSVLSECVFVSAAMQNEDAQIQDELFPIKMEIKEEDSNNNPRSSESYIENKKSNACPYMTFTAPYFVSQPSTDTSNVVPAIPRPQPAQHIGKKKRARQARKQRLTVVPSFEMGTILGKYDAQVHEISTTSRSHTTMMPVTATRDIDKTPGVKVKVVKRKAAIPPCEQNQKKAHQSKRTKPKKKPLYLKEESECNGNYKEWIKVKRARNTKQFHDKRKQKLSMAVKLLEQFISKPTCRKEMERDAGLLHIINEYFPEVLNPTSSLPQNGQSQHFSGNGVCSHNLKLESD